MMYSRRRFAFVDNSSSGKLQLSLTKAHDGEHAHFAVYYLRHCEIKDNNTLSIAVSFI